MSIEKKAASAELAPDSAQQGTVWTPEHAAEYVRTVYGGSVESVLAVGQALAEAKKRLPHGPVGRGRRADAVLRADGPALHAGGREPGPCWLIR